MNLLVDQGPLALFLALLIGHALADFPLQGEYLAKQKVRRLADGRSEWVIALTAHSLIHMGMVWAITGSLVLGVAEFVLHSIIDLGKGNNKFGILTDQILHVVCKVGYVAILCAWF